jgi:hypothetical protein
MYKLFTDKTELFECQIQLEGASLKNSQARLIIESPEVSLLFQGKIDNLGNCQIPIKKLKGLLDESTEGKIKLEVIAEDTYFTPWSSDFKVAASKQVTVEVKHQDAQLISESTPKIQVSGIKEKVENREINLEIKNHINRLLKVLLREDINLENIEYKKDKLNNIIGIYTERYTIKEDQTHQIIKGLLNELK